jgi:hypothetical protein
LYVRRPLKAAILAGALVTGLAAAVIFLTGIGSPPHGDNGATAAASGPAGVVDQVVYTTRTANDAAITLPAGIRDDLVRAGKPHQSIELDRIGYSGDVATSVIDMTPRTGNSGQDPVIKVQGRAIPVIEAKVSGIQAAINSPGAAAGGRALYTGLTKTDFSGAPVIIISSGLDLSNPDDFRSLNWSVPPSAVVGQVEKFRDMPALRGPVTFVLVPTAGSQPQLGQAQKAYVEGVWSALLRAAGATSVTFIDADSATVGSAAPGAPTVPVPGAPPTPIPQVPVGHGKVKCTVPDSLFTFKTPKLINAMQTEKDLAPCIRAALDAHATFALDGWTSYEGVLSADGRPAINEPFNIELSAKRVKAIESLLVHDLKVPVSQITHMAGHGNLDQPNPDPRSAANRVVVITYAIQ